MCGYLLINQLDLYMKNILLLFLVFFVTSTLMAQRKTEVSFSVRGNCSACEKNIEAAYDVKGIVFADYDLENETMTVVYKTKHFHCGHDVQKLAANVGYDTQDIKADEVAYSKLSACCKYRDPSSKNKCSGDH
tara:strand:- start:69 stop:467 length:399 start_codon:yes stop_codon:yes gene_type:complete